MPAFGQTYPSPSDPVTAPLVPGGTTPVQPPVQPPAAAPNTTNQPIIGTINGKDPRAVEDALHKIPGREQWHVVGSPQPVPAPDGKSVIPDKFLWNVSGPTGQPDTMIVTAAGDIDTPPQTTPEKPTSKELTPVGPDANGDYWLMDPNDPTHPQKIEGITGKEKAPTANPYPGGVHTLPDGSIVGIKSDGTQETVSPPGKFANGVKQLEDGSIVGIDANGKAVQIVGPQQKPLSAAEQANVDLAKRKLDADIEAQNATQAASRTRLDIEKRTQDWTEQYQKGLLDEQRYRDNLTQANQEAQQAIDRATLAVRSQEVANNAWFQQQQAQNASKQTENTRVAQEAAAKNAENQTALQAAGELEKNRSNLANEATQRGQVGAGLLNDRATHATTMLNDWINAAAGSKNFGLGGALPENLGPGLMGDAGGFSTQQMGGQSVMDAATQMVHAANPDLAKTPAGAGWVALVSQMLEQHMNQLGNQQQQQPESQPAQPSLQIPTPQVPSTDVPAPLSNTTNTPAPFVQSDIHEGTARR